MLHLLHLLHQKSDRFGLIVWRVPSELRTARCCATIDSNTAPHRDRTNPRPNPHPDAHPEPGHPHRERPHRRAPPSTHPRPLPKRRKPLIAWFNGSLSPIQDFVGGSDNSKPLIRNTGSGRAQKSFHAITPQIPRSTLLPVRPPSATCWLPQGWPTDGTHNQPPSTASRWF